MTNWTMPTPTEPEGPTTGAERGLLQGQLDWQRRTLLNIGAGLDGDELAGRPIPSSGLTLLGLLRHLRKVERTWFRIRVAGEDVAPVFDPALGHTADFDLLEPANAAREVDDLVAEWALCDAAVAPVSLDHEIDVRGETLSLRMVYLHVITEYARHNGHADLLREATDGETAR